MLPEYYVLKEKLINLIESGQSPDNHLAPSERELIEKYNISRITARWAIKEIVPGKRIKFSFK